MELYIHIPFCIRKCRYCSFVSYAAKEDDYEAYIRLLLKEAKSRREEMPEPVRTVYIGGGTPSLLSPVLIRELAEGLRNIYGFDKVDEFTVEANPGTVTQAWLETAVKAGVNRVSFGMQAFQEELLILMGRIHRFEDVRKSVYLARSSGINNVSIDLMFGIPGQTEEDWTETLEAALSLHPEHISAYGLIPEEGTPIFDDLEKGHIHLPDPDVERKMYSETVRILRMNGLLQYEISNFARQGYECRHNIGYWTQVPYIGLGVSAASMIGVHQGPEGMTCVRRNNPDSAESYKRMILEDSSTYTFERIGVNESRFETMMLGLRMNEGVSEEAFFRMHGIPVEACFGGRLHDLERKGLLVHEEGRWKMTERGFDIQNSVLVELMD